MRTQIRLTCTVIDAAERHLVGEEFNCKTKDISVGGLAFETDLLLDEGDRLAVRIHFSTTKQIDVVGWLLRATPIERHGKSSTQWLCSSFIVRPRIKTTFSGF